MKKPRILLADDHQIVLDGLRGILAEDFDLVGEATNGRELMDLAQHLNPDVIVADISMPLLNGIDAATQLRAHGSTAKIVFLTMHPDQTYATRALDAGASAYVLKHAASDELVAAIKEALHGRMYLSAQLRTPSMEQSLTGGTNLKTIGELTPRQRDVLQLIAEGKSAKEVAAILNISPRTAETHKYKIMDELGIKTNAELVQYAIRHGLVSGT
jgi:DNA-binding NarL/FixJ family response regulator